MRSPTDKPVNRARIAYMVTGSIAANFYTVPRMTRDIDVVVELSERDIERFIMLFEDDYYLNPQRNRENPEGYVEKSD